MKRAQKDEDDRRSPADEDDNDGNDGDNDDNDDNDDNGDDGDDGDNGDNGDNGDDGDASSSPPSKRQRTSVARKPPVIKPEEEFPRLVAHKPGELIRAMVVWASDIDAMPDEAWRVKARACIAPQGKRSEPWIAFCPCMKVGMTKSNQASNMRRHLKQGCQMAVARLREAEERLAAGLHLRGSLRRSLHFPPRTSVELSPQQRIRHREQALAVLGLALHAGKPISSFSDPLFKALVKSIAPMHTLASADLVAQTQLPGVYECIVSEIRTLRSSAHDVCLLLDGGETGKEYAAVALSFILPSLRTPVVAYLHCETPREKPWVEVVRDALDKVALPAQDVACVVSADTPGAKKVASAFGVPSVSCMVTPLHRALANSTLWGNGLSVPRQSLPGIDPSYFPEGVLAGLCSELSSIASHVLHACDDTTIHVPRASELAALHRAAHALAIDRWWTYVAFLQALVACHPVRSQPAISSALPPSLTAEDWQGFASVLFVLQPVCAAGAKWSEPCTVSTVAPYSSRLLQFLAACYQAEVVSDRGMEEFLAVQSLRAVAEIHDGAAHVLSYKGMNLATFARLPTDHEDSGAPPSAPSSAAHHGGPDGYHQGHVVHNGHASHAQQLHRDASNVPVGVDRQVDAAVTASSAAVPRVEELETASGSGSGSGSGAGAGAESVSGAGAGAGAGTGIEPGTAAGGSGRGDRAGAGVGGDAGGGAGLGGDAGVGARGGAGAGAGAGAGRETDVAMQGAGAGATAREGEGFRTESYTVYRSAVGAGTASAKGRAAPSSEAAGSSSNVDTFDEVEFATSRPDRFSSWPSPVGCLRGLTSVLGSCMDPVELTFGIAERVKANASSNAVPALSPRAKALAGYLYAALSPVFASCLSLHSNWLTSIASAAFLNPSFAQLAFVSDDETREQWLGAVTAEILIHLPDELKSDVTSVLEAYLVDAAVVRARFGWTGSLAEVEEFWEQHRHKWGGVLALIYHRTSCQMASSAAVDSMWSFAYANMRESPHVSPSSITQAMVVSAFSRGCSLWPTLRFSVAQQSFLDPFPSHSRQPGGTGSALDEGYPSAHGPGAARPGDQAAAARAGLPTGACLPAGRSAAGIGAAAGASAASSAGRAVPGSAERRAAFDVAGMRPMRPGPGPDAKHPAEGQSAGCAASV